MAILTNKDDATMHQWFGLVIQHHYRVYKMGLPLLFYKIVVVQTRSKAHAEKLGGMFCVRWCCPSLHEATPPRSEPRPFPEEYRWCTHTHIVTYNIHKTINCDQINYARSSTPACVIRSAIFFSRSSILFPMSSSTTELRIVPEYCFWKNVMKEWTFHDFSIHFVEVYDRIFTYKSSEMY